MGAFDIIVKYREGLLNGLAVTLQLCAIVWGIGLLIGSGIGVMGAKYPGSFGAWSRVFAFVLGGIPILVLLFWLHYPAQAVVGVVIDPFFTAVLALSFVNIAAVAETVRPVLVTFPKQYIAAAQVCGLSPSETLWHIQMPLVLRQVVPPLLMVQVNMLQATLFASLISVEEIFRVAQRINAVEYRPIEVYTALGVFFLGICLPLNGLAMWLQHRFDRDISER